VYPLILFRLNRLDLASHTTTLHGRDFSGTGFYFRYAASKLKREQGRHRCQFGKVYR
jgi:hypothetical protein